MTIQHNVSSSIRKPGRYFQFNVANAARGLTPLTQRVLLVGTKSSSGSAAANSLHQIHSAAQADALFGQSSELALMCKWAIRGSLDYGKSPEIWACGIAPPTGANATQTITASGTATEAGDVVLRIAGRTVRAQVSSGDAAGTVAASIEKALDAMVADLPVTASVSESVVTCVHLDDGVNGNDVLYEVVSKPAGVGIALAQSVAGTGAADITDALDVAGDKDYDVIAIANHASQDCTDLSAHMASMWAAGTKRWRYSIMCTTTSLAASNTLAAALNDYKEMVICAEGFRNQPGEIAAYIGTILAAEDDPALPWNDVELPSLYLPDADDVPLDSEIETGIAGGSFMLSVNEQGTRAKIVRAVTTKTTHNSAPFYSLLDFTIPRSMTYGAKQIEISQTAKFPRAKKSARVLRAIRSDALAVMEALEAREIWQNVAAHASELVIETDPDNPTRAVMAIPAAVVPPLNQTINVLNLILE